MEGTVRIKFDLVPLIAPRFTYPTGNKHDPVQRWAELALPEEIVTDPRFIAFLNCPKMHPGDNSLGDWIPDADSNGGDGFATLDTEGVLTFYMCFKNYDDEQELFAAMLPLIADDWSLTQTFEEGQVYNYIAPSVEGVVEDSDTITDWYC